MRAARDHADAAAIRRDRGAMPGDVAGLHLETEKPALRSLGLYLLQGLATEELTFVELDSPAQTGLVGVDGLVHVVAPEAERGLEPGRVTGTQSRRQDTLARAALEDRVPDLADTLALHHDLEAVPARVARARDDRGHAGDVAVAESEVGDVVEPLGGHQSLGLGPLEGNQAKFEGAVLDGHVRGCVRAHPVEVFLAIRGVHDGEEAVLR